jgi:hypothetical protein
VGALITATRQVTAVRRTAHAGEHGNGRGLRRVLRHRRFPSSGIAAIGERQVHDLAAWSKDHSGRSRDQGRPWIERAG